MSLFSSILNELVGKLNNKEQYKIEISEIISTVLGITITPDQIIINKNTVFINSSPTIKTAVLLKQQKILDVLKKYNIKTIG